MKMQVSKLGMIGVGSMGASMSLLFAELGIEVNFYDPSQDHSRLLLEHAKEAKVEGKIKHRKDYESLCESLASPKVFVLSVPFGRVGDETIDELQPYLQEGDILMDASNEHWLNTERRQNRLRPDAVHYIGMGVSGGYQSARHGPSISPGGSEEALNLVMPFLETVAARDRQGRPCVTKVGPGGSGHYVKMVHNGIEHGMLSTLCEVWSIMNQTVGMEYDDIASAFDSWNRKGPLESNYLISIGADICRTRDPKDNSYVLANVRDKVVQDVDDTEGTGTWTCEEAVRLHVPTPTITSAHLFRLASADAARREKVKKAFSGGFQPSKMQLSGQEQTDLIKDLQSATYASFLVCFIQGLHIIEKASHQQQWSIDFASILQLSAALEYIKYTTSTELPTQFMEAQMDYFGAHMFDLKSAEPGKPVTGQHHFEWKPAKGILDSQK